MVQPIMTNCVYSNVNKCKNMTVLIYCYIYEIMFLYEYNS